jgi:glycosyltransferase involved in cell wall biosynthesis
MKTLMLAQSPVAGDARVLREASALADAGYRVRVIGRDVPAGFTPPPGVSVSSVGRSEGLRRNDLTGRSSPLIRTARWLLLPEHRARVERSWSRQAANLAEQHRADVVHAHDFNTLDVGLQLADRWNVPLIYDAHEYWHGRPRIGRPTPVRTGVERRREQQLGDRAAAVLTVGDGVANLLTELYGWHHVHVVRNTFPLRRGLELPDVPSAAAYVGRLAPYRELEVIAAASRHLRLPVRCFGPADDSWLARFDPGDVEVHPALSLDDADRVLADAGLALVTHSNRWVNHRLALPNKLFHAVRVGVPVVASDVGELGDAIRRYGLGTLYRPGDSADLVRAVDAALQGYPHLRQAVEKAAPELSWPTDEAALLEVYQRLVGTSRDPARPATGGADAG